MTRPAIIIDDELRQLEIVIPEHAGDLQVFREWSASDSFPDTGRIDYMQGTIEIDISPEDLQRHGQPKGELFAYIRQVVGRQGQIFTDRSRLMHPAVGLSCEPDIVYVTLDSLRCGRVRYTHPDPESEKLLEIVGPVALVVEIVSDSSVRKDFKRLPPLYAQAGVEELWLLDARGKQILFEVRHLVDKEWATATADGEGYVASGVFGRRIRVRREPWEMAGIWQYYVDDDVNRGGGS